MATVAIGDIHGNLSALDDLLGQIRGEVGADDTVVFLGDYIDRGPHSRGCVDAVLRFQRDVRAAVVYLRGNHEDWFLRTLRDHSRHTWLLGMEALDTIRSYSPEAARTLKEAISRAGAELFVGQRPYRTRRSSTMCQPNTFDSLRSCGSTIEQPTACAVTGA